MNTVAYTFNNVLVSKDFKVNLNLLGWFLARILLESAIKFLVDPYYEPLLWFMILEQIPSTTCLKKFKFT